LYRVTHTHFDVFARSPSTPHPIRQQHDYFSSKFASIEHIFLLVRHFAGPLKF